MSVVRVNHFEARPGAEQRLHDFLRSVIETIVACPGCESCRLLRSLDNPAKLVIIEQWDRTESHAAAAKAIPPARMAEVMGLIAAPPSGAFYQESMA